MIKTDIEIVTASFENLNHSDFENFVLVSAVGKIIGNYTGVEKVKRIKGINTYRIYDNYKASDFKACFLLYKGMLERLTFKKILDELVNLCIAENSHRVVILGHGNQNDFCYRHILADFMRRNGINVSPENKVDMNRQNKYWEEDIYKLRGHQQFHDLEVYSILESTKWIFAKTMPNNPHFYLKRSDFGDKALFFALVCHIRYFGYIEEFQGVIYRVWTYKNHSYWTMPCDLLNEDVDLINKKIIL